MEPSQVNLPPIQHVLKGLFHNNPTDYQKNHQRRSSFGYNSTIEAARCLQKMSSAGSPCYHCTPAAAAPAPAPAYHGYQNMQFNRTHRRTVSATLEAPFYQPMHPHAHSVPQPQQQMQCQPIPFPRRARAHTTSGYPPTMVFAPRQYHPTSPPAPSTITTATSPPAPSQTTSHQLISRSKETSGSTHRYHCQHCSKTFSRPSSLRIHIYSHTGEKPFVCHHQGCGRSFSVHSNMRRHLRVHYYSHQQQQQQQQPKEQQGRQVLTSMRLPIIPAPQKQQQQQQERELIPVLP